MAVDDLLGIDRLVSHGGVDVAVAYHELGDVEWHPVHDRVRDEQPSLRKSWGLKVSGRLVASVRPVRASASLSMSLIPAAGIGRFSTPMWRWNRSGIGGFQTRSWLS
ncbi:hypothetical protein [Streptomyces sp. R41]|uniref:Uncharacterized protein n=1 Tax=Streptomyces sp. R41 TaxID=3238632 RepID=A0AB39RTC0_9ACTN